MREAEDVVVFAFFLYFGGNVQIQLLLAKHISEHDAIRP